MAGARTGAEHLQSRGILSSTPRPRRVLHLKQVLTIRPEQGRTGRILRFTGEEAKSSGLVEDVFDLVERWLQPGGGRGLTSPT